MAILLTVFIVCGILLQTSLQQSRVPTPPTNTAAPTAPPPSCADHGWKYYNGSCYYLSRRFDPESRLSWYAARRKCLSSGGDLVSVLSEDENNYLTTLLSTAGFRQAWMGLNQLDQDQYVWSDGKPTSYFAWGNNEQNDGYGTERCVDISGHDGRTNKCYYVGGLGNDSSNDPKLGWIEARDVCRNLTSPKRVDIGSINSLRDQELVTLLLSSVISDLWIGFTGSVRQSSFIWQDDSEVTYTNWASGEPQHHNGFYDYNNWSPGVDMENCVEMLRNTKKPSDIAKWNDAVCSKKNAYICQTLKAPATTTVPSPSGSQSTPATTTVPSSTDSPSTPATTTVPSSTDSQSTPATTTVPSSTGSQSTPATTTVPSSTGSQFTPATTTVPSSTGSQSTPATTTVPSSTGSQSTPATTTVPSSTDSQSTPATTTVPSSTDSQSTPATTTVPSSTGSPSTPATTTVPSSTDSPSTPATTTVPSSTDSQSTPATTTVPSSTGSPSTPACPKDFLQYKTTCFSLVNDPQTWGDARKSCQAQGGDLASTQDVFEVARLDLGLYNDGIQGQAWIGLRYNMESLQYGWTDSWPVLRTFWSSGNPDLQNNDSCVAFSNGQWNDTSCIEQLPSICEIRKDTPPPTTPVPPGRCGDHKTQRFRDFCYLIKWDEQLSWPEASHVCGRQGMLLSSIHSDAELQFLIDQIDASESTSAYYGMRTNFWIGLIRDRAGGYSWSDRAPVEYINWADGEPTYRLNNQNSSTLMEEECVEMYRHSGQWNDLSCIGNKQGYICKGSPVFPTTVTTTSTTPQSTVTSPDSFPLDSSTTRMVQTDSTVATTPTTPTTRPAVYHMPSTEKYRDNDSLTGGQIAGIVIGLIGASILIAAAIVFIYKRRYPLDLPGKMSSAKRDGYENALYVKGDEEDLDPAESEKGKVKMPLPQESTVNLGV